MEDIGMSTTTGRRAISIAIDVAVSAVWWIPFARIEHGPGALRLSWFGLRAVIPAIITIAYFAVLPMFAGTTIGMLAMRLRMLVVPTGSRTLPPPPGGDPPPT
jgi:hypothetical protein